MMRISQALVATVLLTQTLTYSCSKLKKSSDKDEKAETSHNAQERELTIGMYKSASKALADSEADYFLVTSDHDICLLRKELSRFYRDCLGNLSDATYFFDGVNLQSGDIKGKKISEAEVLEEHKLIFNLIMTAKEINADLKKENLAVDILLVGTYMEFTSEQLNLLKALKSDLGALKEFLKHVAADKLEISDYTNSKPYLKDKTFDIAKGITIDVEKMVKEIKEKTIDYDRF